MPPPKEVPARIEKIMSIKPSEFNAGITRLDASAVSAATTAGDVTTYRVNNDAAGEAGPVPITFEELEPARPGGLISLPRARVTLHVDALGPDARRIFLARFDQTFQRGGG